MAHQLKDRVVDGYTAQIFQHDNGGDFIRLGNPKGEAIWLGTLDGSTFQSIEGAMFSDLEADYQAYRLKESA